MDTQVKQPLAKHLKQIIASEYGSGPKAAAQLGIGYEVLKKALQRNQFSPRILGSFFPGLPFADLEDQYEFSLSRNYKAKSSVRQSTVLTTLADALDQNDITFISQNMVVRERLARLVHEECERLRNLLGAT